MPQMKPLNWIFIFVMFLMMLMIMFSSFPMLSSNLSFKKMISKKYKMMKW